MIAFSFGLVFILDGSSELSDDNGDGDPLFDENDGTWGTFLHNFANLMFKMMFIILDPGQAPPIPNTTAREKFATIMFVIYCVFSITILLNLCITLMNATIQRFQDRRQLYWKFQKTSICIEFFEDKLSLPVPFSTIHILWTLIFLPLINFFTFCYYGNKKKDEPESKHLSRIELQARRRKTCQIDVRTYQPFDQHKKGKPRKGLWKQKVGNNMNQDVE